MSFQREQFSWKPSIETGLSGEKSLDEIIEFHIDAGETRDQVPGIYVIEHSKPQGGVDVHEAMWAKFHNTVPEFITAIANAEKLMYVGAGEDVYQRIMTHVEADSKCNCLAKPFPVHGVMNIIPTETAEDAFPHEQQVMYKLREQYPSWYIRSA